MEQISERSFVEIPGGTIFELPPLMFSSTVEVEDNIFKSALEIAKSDCLRDLETLSDEMYERAKWEFACQLNQQYIEFCLKWSLGNSISSWMSQCKEAFMTELPLSNILRPDVWPYPRRNSLVRLLGDKHYLDRYRLKDNISLSAVVGLSLLYRQCPTIDYLSGQSLFYLASDLAEATYTKWADSVPKPVKDLPPERFHFEVFEV